MVTTHEPGNSALPVTQCLSVLNLSQPSPVQLWWTVAYVALMPTKMNVKSLAAFTSTKETKG